MDITIDCDNIEVDTCGDTLQVSLKDISETDLISAVGDNIDPSDIIDQYGQTTLFEYMDNDILLDEVDTDDKLESVGVDECVAHFDYGDILLNIPDEEIISNTSVDGLLRNIDIDEVIAFYGESAFAHLAPQQTNVTNVKL